MHSISDHFNIHYSFNYRPKKEMGQYKYAHLLEKMAKARGIQVTSVLSGVYMKFHICYDVWVLQKICMNWTKYILGMFILSFHW